MRVPRIFIDQKIVVGNCVNLSVVANHHITNVLRMTVGRPIILFNGKGGEYTGVISDLTKKVASIEITDFHDINRESPLSVELAVCLIKNERMDWLLQKATELGVNNISLLVSERTDYKLKTDRIAKKLQHWRQVVISACEQSGRTKVPIIHPPLALEAWLKNVKTDKRYILDPNHHTQTDKGSQKLLDDHDKPSSLTLLIGPEGGFNEMEFSLALDNQFCPLTLGPRILRAETASLAALALAQRQFGGW